MWNIWGKGDFPLQRPWELNKTGFFTALYLPLIETETSRRTASVKGHLYVKWVAVMMNGLIRIFAESLKANLARLANLSQFPFPSWLFDLGPVGLYKTQKF